MGLALAIKMVEVPFVDHPGRSLHELGLRVHSALQLRKFFDDKMPVPL
jgi:hypothetical protein